ncbi:AraC family transcriptional regulator [uncultured Maribacter sp.]|uniref:helix-turn-helix domain-containing protein n=1 Tax=uncultured Maribacter sp. TaxID=431308 RepID=UPI002620916F|nr:AraC family transcriptional regulator [uncultured Maribacter sp.]
MKHNKEKQMLYSDTPFLKGEFSYAELEEGLWMFQSDMKYKNNVSYKPIYDRFLPADYYFISINFIENKFKDESYEFNNFKITNHSLSFSRPKTDFINCHFKDSHEIMYILYFSEKWVTKNIINSTSIPEEVKKLLNDTSISFLNYNFKYDDFKLFHNDVKKGFNNSLGPNMFELKKLAYDFFELFFNSLEEKENFNTNELSHGDRIKIQKIEYFISSNLYEKFPGIDFLSEKYKISPTKLKENFKLLFGKPIFTYFQENRMGLALKYIKEGDIKIKDIALKFNYENASKFSKAFYKCHNKLPSDINKYN